MNYQEINDQVDRQLKCDCAARVVGYIVASNGVKQYRRWCQRCGSQTTSLKRDSLSYSQQSEAVLIDPEVNKKWWERRKQLSEALTNQARHDESVEWWARYNEYLRSDKWKTKRERVLKRDNYLCQACLLNQATQVHHSTYEHVFNEPLFELFSVCDSCHEKLTTLDRERRGVVTA